MTAPMVLVHGAWVTSSSWRLFKAYLEQSGRQVFAPSWPMLDGRSPRELRASMPAGFGSLTLSDIIDHLAGQIRSRLVEQPVLIGHSFGGLLVQLLLDRGIGRAGMAINPAPIAGVVPDVVAARALLPILLRPAAWRRPYEFDRRRFGSLYATKVESRLVDTFFEQEVISAPGMIFHQAALWRGNRVNASRRQQPLLITSSSDDRLTSPTLIRRAVVIQSRAQARTDYHHFSQGSHLLTAEPGWERVAQLALGWIDAVDP